MQLPLIVEPTSSHGRLTLGIWSPADADEMGAWWRRNRPHLEPTQRDRPESHWTAAGQRDRIARNSADVEAGRLLPLLVREDGALVGEVLLSDVAEDRPASFGYGIDSERLGRRIASDAVHAVVQLAFTELGVPAIETTTERNNLASQRVLVRNGFVPVGAGRKDGEHAQQSWRLVR